MTKHGFTLIELLVVVLIIGILSAVALPQYTKAVEKSRATEALTLMRSVAEAVRLYHLSNGSYPASLDDLDVTIPYPKVNDSTYANNEWKLMFYPQDNVMGYSLRMLRVKGKYRDNGFHYFIGRDKSGLSGLYCLEYWTPDTYCTKGLGLKNPHRLSGYGHFTRMYVYSL
ncbi:MAG: prepilin-type N-terminal cleavage/methylation domain-containing protein [Elusimicrobiales bacterium]|nr:prepilin-type N-terminal cleavage/methylation domain-containing protein [Elusimicrobiales bacterium]